MGSANGLLSRPPDDLPEARVWRPELQPDVAVTPGLPVQPALIPAPARVASPRTLTEVAAGERGSVVVTRVGAAPRVDLPDVRRWAVNLGVAVVEVLLGHRALGQLLRWLDEDTLGVLGLACAAVQDRVDPARPRERIVVGSTRVQVLAPTVAEVCLHAGCGGDRLLVAFRLVADDRRWRCTALELLAPGAAAAPRRPATHGRPAAGARVRGRTAAAARRRYSRS